MNLSEKQKKTFKLIEKGENCLILGRAGSGKSVFVDHLRENLENAVFCAPTGVAALNIKGSTINSVFQIPPHITETLEEFRGNSDSKLVLTKMETLVIDEISMVNASLFELMDQRLREVRGSDLPFGGVQLVFIGDLFQLPPVIKREVKDFFNENFGGVFFFDSNVYKQLKINNILFEDSFRQLDKKFIEFLDEVRVCSISQERLDMFNKKHVTDDIPEEAVILTTRIKKVDEYNKQMIDSIEGKEFQYGADFNIKKEKQKEFPGKDLLTLKVGARVMFVVNSSNGLYINGTLGTVMELKNDSIKVLIDGSKEAIFIKKYSWEMVKQVWNSKKKKIIDKGIGDIAQFPLIPAKSFTIHRSQGKTFGSVYIDTFEGTFDFGQMYVALSRVKSEDDVLLKKPIRKEELKQNKQINNFYNNFVSTQKKQ